MKTDKGSSSSQKLSLKFAVKRLVARITLIALSTSFFMLTLAFVLQAKAGLTSEVYSFLFLSKDSIVSLQRELGYDNLVGYDYVIKYLKEEYSFTDISRFDDRVPLNCLYEHKFQFRRQKIAVCLNKLSEYKIVFDLVTLKGTKYLVFTKPFNLISQYFLTMVVSFLLIIGMMGFLFCYFYNQLISVSVKPFLDLYRSLLEKVSYTESPYLEIHEIEKNITENIEKQRQLDRLKVIAETVEITAHDFRKPLNMVSIFIKRIKKLPHDELIPYVEKSTREIEKVTKDTDQLAQDLLDVNRDRPTILERKCLSKVVQEMIWLYYRKNDIALVYDEVIADFDQSKFTRSIMNILNNAIEASGGKGKIWVKVFKKDLFATVEVGNTGSYIEKDDLGKIFDSYWTRKKSDGKGLGLAIAKKFVEDQGGKISCETDGFCALRGEVSRLVEDHYVIFRIELPIDHSTSYRPS